jgi:hypothetical protein
MFYLFLFFISCVYADFYVQKVPVSDLRLIPSVAATEGFDPYEESQGLLGDFFESTGKEKGDFIEVRALSQLNFNEPLEAWMLKESLQKVEKLPTPSLIVNKPWTTLYVSVPMQGDKVSGYLMPAPLGSYLEGVEKEEERYKVKLPGGKFGYIPLEDVDEITSKTNEEIRKQLVENGSALIGSRYYLGGASPSYKEAWFGPRTGFDAGSLAYLLYKAQGKIVPRHILAQYVATTKVEHLQIGDLLFLAEEESKKFHHVLIYMGGELFLEASPFSGVRLVNIEERIGKPLKQIQHKDKIGTNYIYFGSFL